jgi:aminoglycoside phosphotransferase (APT) family kinase protein
MEDLSTAVQSGYFFGPGSPLNWGKDLPALTQQWPGISCEDITLSAFEEAAALHAKFWQDPSLLARPWLRAADWRQGQGKASWDASQARITACWAKAAAQIETGDAKVNWDPLMIGLMTASVGRIDWDAYQRELATQPFTLTHGDFHPGNIMVRSLSETAAHGGAVKIALLDFEVIGLGNGAQDLGQFMISHVAVAARRQLETKALDAYYTKLVDSASADADLRASYPHAVFLRDYAMRGFCRWVWLLALLTSMCPAAMVQFWHDQMLAFAHDHGLTADNIAMPVA